MPPELDLVDWPADRTVAVSGSAGSLRLPLTLKNASAKPARVTELSLAEVRLAGKGAALSARPAPVRLEVASGGVARTELKLRLDPQTPPGRYEGKVQVAGLSRAVVIEVLADVKLQVRPAPAILDAGAGLSQRLTAAFANLGNVSLLIDLSGPYPLGEEAPVPADPADRATEGGAALKALFASLTGRETRPALVKFGTVEFGMVGGPLRLEPGQSRSAELAVKLPEGLSPQGRYHAFAPLYATDLHLVVVTATKSPAPPPRRSPAKETPT